MLKIILFVIYLIQQTSCTPLVRPQRITDLPGLTNMPEFDMYSGYLKAGSSSKNLFYWLNRSQQQNSRRLIVWIQGGPGCSSLYGLMKENGPFTFNDETGQLDENPHSWNQFAHTLYIDAPIKTGFSFDGANDTISDDVTTAENIVAAMEYFIDTLHTEYADADIYFAGESYAGIYVPALVHRIMTIDSSLKPLVKGIMLGDPNVNALLKDSSRPAFAYRKGLISKDLFYVFKYIHCFTQPLPPYLIGVCKNVKGKFYGTFYSSGKFNPANYGKPCFKPEFKPLSLNGHPKFSSIEVRRQLIKRENYCLNVDPLEAYFNRQDVKEAIHASTQIQWESCSPSVVFHHIKNLPDMTSQFKDILHQWEIPVLLYYGNQDFHVNFVGGEEFISRLNLPDVEPRSPFTVVSGNTEAAVAMHKHYGRLHLFIIYNAGHFAVVDKPFEASKIVEHFINETEQNN